MDPGLLVTFLLVADEGNLTRAAERRHTTPSAASAQLRLLEDRLGIALFSRSRRGMELTAEGKALLDPATRALDGLSAMLRVADGLRGGVRGPVRLGLNSPPEFLRLTQLLAQIRDRAPEVDVGVSTGLSRRIIRQVADGELDAGFVFAVARPKEVDAAYLADIEVRAVAPANWAADRLPEDGDALAALPWIEPDGDCPLRESFSLLLGERAGRARVIMRSDGEASTLALVKAGMGVGLLDRNYANAAIEAGQVKVLDPPMSVGLHFIMAIGADTDPKCELLKSIVLGLWADEPAAPPLEWPEDPVVWPADVEGRAQVA